VAAAHLWYPSRAHALLDLLCTFNNTYHGSATLLLFPTMPALVQSSAAFSHKCVLVHFRDGHAHGSHTSSTAAGNFGPTAPEILPGTMSGVAPHARIAMYKVGAIPSACWVDLSYEKACL